MSGSVFTLHGEIVCETQSIISGLRSTDRALETTEHNLAQTEQKAKDLGKTNAVTARSFEKMNDKIADTERRLKDSITAFNKGEITAKQLAKAIDSADKSYSSINNRAKDLSARMTDASNKTGSFTTKLSLITTGANLAADGLRRIASEAKDFVIEGAKMNATLDKAVRFTATLDKSFQTPFALKTFTEDIKKLSTEIPHSAEAIANASFTIKSAFGDLNEKQTIEYLRQFGIAATASNTGIAEHTERVAALAKQYSIAAKDLPRFNALLATSFGQALAKDSEVADGFNRILNSAKAVKQPLETVIAAMSTLQGASNDAAGNTTLLVNALGKLTDEKYREGFEGIGIAIFDAKGQFRDLKDIIGDMAKAMDGLSDKQIADKFAFLKDKEAREAFLTLARNKQAFDKVLADGANLDAYQKKTDLMLTSTEARWNKFYATIDNLKMDAGKKFSDQLLSAFDSTTTEGTIALFFNNIGINVAEGLTELLGIINKGGTYLVSAFDSIFGTDFATPIKADLDKRFSDITNFLETVRDKNAQGIITGQAQYWQKVLADPLASPELRAQAQKNLEETQRILNAQADASALKTYESWKKQGDAIVEALRSSDPQIKEAAQKQAETLQKSIAEALGNANFSKDLKQKLVELSTVLSQVGEGKEVYQSFKDLADKAVKGLTDGTESGKAKAAQEARAIVDALNDALKKENLDPAFADKLRKLLNDLNAELQRQGIVLEKTAYNTGQNVWQGLVGGMLSGRGSVSAAAASLSNAATVRARQEFQTASPSKVFIEIGKNVSDGLALGIEQNAPKVAKVLQNNIAKQIKDFKKQLDEILKGNKTATEGYGKTSGLEKQIFDADKVKSQINEVKNLRNELGINLGKALIPADLPEEIRQLNWYKDTVGDLMNFIKDNGELTANAALSFTNVLSNPDLTAYIAERAKAIGQTADQIERIISFQSAGLTDWSKLFPSQQGRPYDTDPNHGLSDDTIDIFGDVPRVKKAWEDFFKTFQSGIANIKASLPDIKTAIGENLLNSIYSIGDVFADAVTHWDGTAKGFFKSLAQGFARMAQEIISQLIRIMIMQTVMKIVGAFAGAGGGTAHDVSSTASGISGSLGGHFTGASGSYGFADGGFTGFGSKFDLAGLVHKGEFVMPMETVRHWGLGFLNQIKNNQMPPVYAGGATTNNNQRQNVFHINVSGGRSREENQQTGTQITRAIMQKLRSEERR